MQIGRYEILMELGRGAMGAVYQARDPQIDRIVAIKVILTQGLTAQELEGYKQRFIREARAAGKMSHPGIVTIFDIAEDDSGHPCLVMEFVEGSTLEDLAEQRRGNGERLPFEQALDIGIQVASALDYAHKRGVVHRDVKPANVLVTSEGIAKIADFGIAKMSGVSLTRTGSFLGTPAFMSPEQFSGNTIDARSDLFSLGAMLYWIFAGEHPFPGDTLTTVSFKIVFAYPPPVTQVNPALPADVHTVLMRCLAKNPDERYASCRDLAADLEAIKHGKPVKATPLPLKEATIVNAPAVAVSLMATGVGSTMAEPPQQAGTETLSTAPPVSPTAATTLMEKPAAASASTTARPKRSGLLGFLRARPLASTAAGVLLLAALVAGGLWLWPALNSAAGKPESRPAAERSQRAEPVAPPVAPPPVEEPKEEPKKEESGPPPHAKASSRARNKRPAPYTGPTGILVIECQHNFKDGSLEVLMDGEPLVTLALRGETRNLGVIDVTSGMERRTITVPTGQHLFTVRARANRGEYRADDEIGGRFSQDATRIMLVEFGKGSGIKVFDRKLTLSWK